MGSPNGSNDTPHIPPPLSFYNTFKPLFLILLLKYEAFKVQL
jgi:hypothetical protein